MSGLIWIKTVWHSNCIPERIFQKSDSENKKAAEDKETWKNNPAGKEFNVNLYNEVTEIACVKTIYLDKITIEPQLYCIETAYNFFEKKFFCEVKFIYPWKIQNNSLHAGKFFTILVSADLFQK